ncbi:ribosomal protein S18 acetylase RimI-like enzyme [Curtobacterium sp. PhB130]|nr:ribosomal protein S18 acetylase RimI-like enzyme [Curtobacterium sp. PhB130]
MPEDMRITERTDADLDTLVEVLWRVHTDGYPATWPDDPRAWLCPEGLLGAWVAVEDDRIVGHVGIAVPGPGRMPEVTRLFVDPSHRSRGLADGLLDAAERFAPGPHIRLDVTEETPAAWRLYERRGWRLTGTGLADWSKPSGETPLLRFYAKRVG